MIDPGVLVRRIRSLAPTVPFTTGFLADEDEAKVSGFNEGKTAALFEVFKMMPYEEVEKLGRQGIAEAATYCCEIVHKKRSHAIGQLAAFAPGREQISTMRITCNKCGKKDLSWSKRRIGGSPETWQLWSAEQGWHFDVCPGRFPGSLDTLVENKIPKQLTPEPGP